MKRVFQVIAIALILFVLFLMTVRFETTSALVEIIPLGWLRFLERNISQMTWNSGLFCTAVLCSFFLLAGGHWLLRTFFKQLRANTRPVTWKWRWTIMLYCALWLCFATAFGTVGLFRHAFWLSKETQPWYMPSLGYHNEIRMADGALQTILLETGQDLTKTRQAVMVWPMFGHVRLSDEFDVLLYANNSNKVDAYIIIPRESARLKKRAFLVSTPENSNFDSPLSELPATLSRLDTRYPASKRAPDNLHAPEPPAH
jgi:hypothetical protein